MVEKRKPHHKLDEIKRQCGNAKSLRMTFTAQRDALELGFSHADVVEVVKSIEPRRFYKSMTSNTNNKIWQDVYHVPWEDLVLYVKFSANIVCELTVVSFKEK